MKKEQSKGSLLRMRQSGWFDILMLLGIIAGIFAVMGIIGVIRFHFLTTNLPEGITAFEVKQSLGFFSGHYKTYFYAAAVFAVVCAFGLLCLRFISPVIQGSLEIQLKMRKVRKVMQYLLAIIVTLIMLFPIYWMIVSSFKSSDELLMPVPTLWPKEFHFENYPNVLKRAPFGRYFFNTIVSTFFIMVAQLSIGILAAYGFSKGNFKFKNGLFLVVLGALMVPIQVTFIPIYVLISRFNWLNTFMGLIVPNLVSAYFIFMLRQTFMSVDNSYIEAGKLDGMGRFGAIIHVLCPMCAPTLITVSIITFIDGWNSYFWPKMVAPLDTRRTIAVGVARLRDTFAGLETSNYNEIMTGAVMAIVPIILLFLILQKYIMTGMSKAAMK